MVGRKKHKGFSLVEILIALSLFSILVGLGGLSLSLIKRANFKKASEKVQRAIVTARTESMAKGSDIGAICFNTRENGAVYCAKTDASNTMICGNAYTVSYVGAYNAANAVVPVTGNVLRFKTSGIVDSSLGDIGAKYYIQSKDGNLKAEVVVYPVTGKTSLRYL